MYRDRDAMKKRVLVAGGAGFLRSHVCARLLDQQCHALCIDSFFTVPRRNIECLLDQRAFEVILPGSRLVPENVDDEGRNDTAVLRMRAATAGKTTIGLHAEEPFPNRN